MTKFSFKLLQTSSTLFDKNIDYNRLAHKIAIGNLNDPVKRKIERKERKVLHPSTGYDHYSIRAALSVNVISMCNQMLSSGSREYFHTCFVQILIIS